MRIVVTGGSGFTGRRVLARAVNAGHQVSALARSAAAADAVQRLGARPVPGDLDDQESLFAAFASARADCLLNIASMGFGHGPGVVAAAEKAGIERGVFVSTTAVTTRIGAGSRAVRLAAEDAVKTSRLRWTLLRPTMIYGAPGDRNLSRLLALLRRTRIVLMPGSGTHLQQPVHVADLAAAILSAADCEHAVRKTYNVAGPVPISFRRLLFESAAAANSVPRLVPTPLAPWLAGIALYEKVSRQPRLTVEQLRRLAEDKAFDITMTRQDLGVDPRPFALGIREEAELLWP